MYLLYEYVCLKFWDCPPPPALGFSPTVACVVVTAAAHILQSGPGAV